MVSPRGTDRRPGRRRSGRNQLWWYQIGWRGVRVGAEAIIWQSNRWRPIVQAHIVPLNGLQPEQWLPTVGTFIMALKKDAKRAVEGGSTVVADPEAAKKWPTVHAHLTQTSWDDGTPRETSSLIVFAADGCYKVMLRDKEAKLCLWVACPVLGKLLDTLEAALADERSVWRVDRQAVGEKASRVKK